MSVRFKLIEQMETISENEPIELNVTRKTDLNELEKKMEYVSKKIADEFYNINNKLSIVNNIMDLNYNSKYMNSDFNRHEHIEEHMDSLIYDYQTVKALLNKGREIRYLKEIKEKEKDNEIRCARNTLAQFGITSIN